MKFAVGVQRRGCLEGKLKFVTQVNQRYTDHSKFGCLLTLAGRHVSSCSLATSSGQYSLLQLMQLKLAPEVIANLYNLVYIKGAVEPCPSIL